MGSGAIAVIVGCGAGSSGAIMGASMGSGTGAGVADGGGIGASIGAEDGAGVGKILGVFVGDSLGLDLSVTAAADTSNMMICPRSQWPLISQANTTSPTSSLVNIYVVDPPVLVWPT